MTPTLEEIKAAVSTMAPAAVLELAVQVGGTLSADHPGCVSMTNGVLRIDTVAIGIRIIDKAVK